MSNAVSGQKSEGDEQAVVFTTISNKSAALAFLRLLETQASIQGTVALG